MTDKGQTDWRLQTIAAVGEDWTSPWSAQTAPRGSQITVVTVAAIARKKNLTVPLPNGTALMLNASQRSYREAMEIRRRSKIDEGNRTEVEFRSSPDAFMYLECLMESVLTAHAGLEAFVNDQVPDTYEHVSHRRSEVVLEVSDKAAIQRHFGLCEKISDVLPEVLGCPSPKGTSQSWAGYKALKKNRDRITHMKSEDRRSALPDQDTVWNSLVSITPPFQQALSVIRYFQPHLKQVPRWLVECPMT